jgi:hypothetical protein
LKALVEVTFKALAMEEPYSQKGCNA